MANDSSGNPQVDFVWGNMPMQPNAQRTGAGHEVIGDEDRGWSFVRSQDSDTLSSTETVYLSLGDQSYNDNWQNPDTRSVTIEADNHIIAASNYEGYPSFLQGAPYDDTIVNVTVPNVVGFNSVSAAESNLNGYGLVLGTVTTSTVGATSGNNGWVKSQNPASGTVVNSGSAVSLVSYNYVAPSTPVAGIRYDNDLALINPTYRYMFLTGRSSGLQIDDYITISGCSVSDYNRAWQVKNVENDDTFNTGGTRVTIVNGLVTSQDPATAPTAGNWVLGM